MRFEHRFRVKASLAEVADFHSRSSNMPKLSPPPLIVRMRRAPELLAAGDEMEFTLWAGPIPIRWIARIEDASPSGFVDRQEVGPFASWRHRHVFARVTDDTTEVLDQVEASLRRHWWWGPVGLAMWVGLPLLFAYRGWKTRQLLERDLL